MVLTLAVCPSFNKRRAGIIINVAIVIDIKEIITIIVGTYLSTFPLANLYPFQAAIATNTAKIATIILPYTYTSTQGIVPIMPPIKLIIMAIKRLLLTSSIFYFLPYILIISCLYKRKKSFYSFLLIFFTIIFF